MTTQTTMNPAQRAPGNTARPADLCPQHASDQLDAAYAWLCEQRQAAPADADVWDLRFYWAQTRPRLLQQLLAGEYRLTPMQIIKKKHSESLALWDAQDALVLKWVALLVAPQLDLHKSCEHVKGHGGGPASVQRMSQTIQTHDYRFVCRTDIRGYYGNINKGALLEQVKAQVSQPALQNLIAQYVHYTVEYGGEFHTPERGISRGCALSPLMGALHLHAMDEHFSKQKNIYYARYMDDIVILTPTRWTLRRQVKALNGFFNAGGFEQHPEKTFIGRTERGFDWMGAQMSDAGVEGIARRARANHVERCRRLYGRVRELPAALRRAWMAAYRKRWMIWARRLLLSGVISLLTSTDVGATLTNLPGYSRVLVQEALATNEADPRGTTLGANGAIAGLAGGGWAPSLSARSGIYHSRYLNMVIMSPYVSGPGTKIIRQRAWGSCTVTMSLNGVLVTRTATIQGNTLGNSESSDIHGWYARMSLPWHVDDLWPGSPAGSDLSNGTAGSGSPKSDLAWVLPGTRTAGYVVPESISCTPPTFEVTIQDPEPNGGSSGHLYAHPGCTHNGWCAGAGYLITATDAASTSMQYFVASLGISDLPAGGPIPGTEFLFSTMPVCAWRNSAAGDPAYTFQDVTNAQYMQAGHVIETEASPVSVGISCDWGTKTGTVADALVTGWSPSALSADGTEVAFTDDSLALQLLAPTSLPAGVRWAAQQSGLGAPLIWGTSAATAKPLWTWDISSTGGKINPAPVLLTPRLMATKNALSADLGKKTAQVTLILTTK